MKRRHRDRLPHPGDVARDLLDIRRALDGDKASRFQTQWPMRPVDLPLADAYSEAYACGLERTVGEQASSGASVADDGSVPGTTVSIAASKERARSGVSSAAKKIAAALSDLRSARDDLAEALEHMDRRDYDPMERRYPRTVKDSELAEAREKQQQRLSSGS